MKFLYALFSGAVALATLKTRPIAKVITLLSDMKQQLEKEAADDQAVYDKLACWCKTNDQEKSDAVDAAQREIARLESLIEELAGSAAELKTKIANQKKELADNKQALDTAAELRAKQLAEFNEEEKDSLVTIKALEGAIVALSKHHSEDLAQIAVTAKRIAEVHEKRIGSLPFKMKKALGMFIQRPKSYAPQSGQIFGVLRQMKEDFENNLSDAQREEKEAAESFAQLKAAKLEELAAGKKQLGDFEASLADTMEKHAQAGEDLQSTEDQLDTDQKFLLNLRKRCSETDAEFERRSKSRSEEIAAVADTIAILNSDDSFDAFNKSINSPSLLQVSSRRMKVTKQIRARRQAARLLKNVGDKTHDSKLSLIAQQVQLDAFTKVKAAIDEMITELNRQQDDEVKHKDFCRTEFNQNEKDENKANDHRENLEAKMAELTTTMETLTKELDTLNAEIAEMTKQSNRAADNRARENSEFQTEVADQRVTQQILDKARARMAQKYDAFFQQPGANHIELSGSPDGTQPGNGPARFTKYGVSAGGQKVIALLDSVIADSKKSEAEAIADEKDQMAAYEEFVKDTNESIKQKQQAIVEKTAAKATASEAHSGADADHKSTVGTLENLAQYRAELHNSCDFVLNNFEARQAARSDEVEALRQAKAILSGSQ